MSWFARALVAAATTAAVLAPAGTAAAIEPPLPFSGNLYADIRTPTTGATVQVGEPMLIAGRALGSGEGVQIDSVQVSVDGGATWDDVAFGGGTHGTYVWSMIYTPTEPGALTIEARTSWEQFRQTIPPQVVDVTVGPAGPPPAAACPCELDLPELPGGTAQPDPDLNPVELGVRFQLDRDGFITGLRVLRPGTPGSGEVEGHLWGPDGTLLAAAQTVPQMSRFGNSFLVTFAEPVPVSAGQTYTAGYFTAGTQYDSTELYFSGVLLQPPFRTPLDEIGGAGVYAYADAPAFPTSTWNRSNYWVTPIFSS
jgi:Domain of unknown function (DUF4082)/Bacterial Ig domain